MDDLRWVLLGLGALVVVCVYLLSRPRPKKPSKSSAENRQEPVVSSLDPLADPADDPPEAPRVAAEPSIEAEPEPATPQQTDRVIALRLVAKSGPVASEAAILALREEGLQHGDFGIFHRRLENRAVSVFSVASLVEPGSFDLTRAKESEIPGMTLFMVLPNVQDPVVAFDDMVATGRALSVKLGFDLVDEQGSSWSIQRERYVREEIIQYRHQRQGAA